jgi:pimeloyl-ACP methyl ester carboxylesterase
MRVQQYGIGSLDQDADDILALARHLREEYACDQWILAGHSTGTQDAVRYVARHGLGAHGTAPLKAAILLAPVRAYTYAQC